MPTLWYYHRSERDIRYRVELNNYYKKKRLIVDKTNAPATFYDGHLVTGFHHMFDGNTYLEEIIFKDDVELDHITNIRCMFHNCTNLKRIVLPRNAFPNVIDVSFMFQGCRKLEEIIAPGFLLNWTNGILNVRDDIHNESPGLFSDCPIELNNCPIGLNMIRAKGAINIFADS